MSAIIRLKNLVNDIPYFVEDVKGGGKDGIENIRNTFNFGSPISNFDEIPAPLDGDDLYHFRRIIPNEDVKVCEFITKRMNNLQGFRDINNFLSMKKRDDSIERDQTRRLEQFIAKGRKLTTVVIGSEVVGGIGMVLLVDAIRRFIKTSNDQDRSIFWPVSELVLGIAVVGVSGVALCWPQNLKEIKWIKDKEEIKEIVAVQKPEEFLQEFENFLQDVVEERKNRLRDRIVYLRHHIKELKKQNPVNNELIECFTVAKNIFKQKHQNRVHPNFTLEDSSGE